MPWELQCVGEAAVKSSVGALLSGLVKDLSGAVGEVVATTSTWWVKVPSNVACDHVDVSTVDQAYGSPDQYYARPGADPLPACGDLNAVAAIRHDVYLLVVAVLVGGMMVQGIRLALQRRGDPMIRVGVGLAKFAVASAVSLGLLVSAQRAGDAFSTWVLDNATHGDFAGALKTNLTATVFSSGIAQLVFLFIALLASLVQAALMLFREGALAVLSGLVLLAAAGSMTESTQAWWGRVTGWMTALVLYKPAAALIYAAGFTLIGTAQGPQAAFVGLTTYALAILALPVLMRLTSWTAGEVAGGGGGAAQLLTSLGYAAQSLGRGGRRGGGEPAGGWSANQQAEHMSKTPPAGPTGPPALPPGPGGPGGGSPVGDTASVATGGPAGAGVAGVAETGRQAKAAAEQAAGQAISPPNGTAPSTPWTPHTPRQGRPPAGGQPDGGRPGGQPGGGR
jgi:hypothetical protein